MLRFFSRPPAWPLAISLAAVAALGACADQTDPTEPQRASVEKAVATQQVETGVSEYPPEWYWADGYLSTYWEDQPLVYPSPHYVFNRAAVEGGPRVTVTKPEGTTGQYVATFPGLSSYLGSRSTLHVSGFWSLSAVHCKPMSASLVRDKVEVRCFDVSSGLPANSEISVLVNRNDEKRAFAYAHREKDSNYSPSAKSSWNPAGTTTVTRSGVGQYRVTFSNLASRLPNNLGSNVQVNAVGAGNAYCNVQNWTTTGTPNVSVDVRCYSLPTGALVDQKFNVNVQLGHAEHVGYLWNDQPTLATYYPSHTNQSSAGVGRIVVTRVGVGAYWVEWAFSDPHILGDGNAQVTAYGSNSVCKIGGASGSIVDVRCFAPNGAPADSRFMVLFGS